MLAIRAPNLSDDPLRRKARNRARALPAHALEPTVARMSEALHEARFWRPLPNGKLLCFLCPRLCEIPEGKAGFCFIRANEGGRLVNLGYGKSTGFAVDPIEKKPLNHFLPGTSVLSFGTAGCNLGCRFCQNWSISKATLDKARSLQVTPQQVALAAQRLGCSSVAFTYNDPVIFAEYAIDVAQA